MATWNPERGVVTILNDEESITVTFDESGQLVRTSRPVESTHPVLPVVHLTNYTTSHTTNHMMVTVNKGVGRVNEEFREAVRRAPTPGWYQKFNRKNQR